MRIRVFLALVASVLFPVAAMADLQKAKDDLAVTQPGQSVWINVLANDGELGDGLRLLKAFKPGHGTAVLENGGIRYTPAAGFQGSDTFRYMAQPAKSQPGEATVNVEVGAGGVALQLRGRVVDDPIPGAEVIAMIGGFEFRTVADANGNYVLDIAALQGDAFVTLIATGESASGAIARFYSAVGEIARLAQESGADGILVRDENNQVQLTNLSTAQFVLLREANEGEIGNDQQLIPLTQSIDLERMLELAAMIKLVVDEGVPLPPGTPDALALISDPAAVASFEASLAPGQLAAAVDAVKADEQVTPAFKAGALPFDYALIPPSAPGTIQPFLGVAQYLEFVGHDTGSSGAGSYYDIYSGSATQMQWALVGEQLEYMPDTLYFLETAVEQEASSPACAGAYFFAQDAMKRTRIRRLQEGAGVDYLQLAQTWRRRWYPWELNPPGCDGELPPESEYEVSNLRLGFSTGAAELPFASNEAFGKISLSYYLPVPQRWGTTLFDFDTHTVAIPGFQPSFTSEVVGGHLFVHLTRTSNGEVFHYEYIRYQTDGRKGEGLFVIATLPGGPGNELVSYNLASRVDGSLPSFAGEPFAGRIWRSGATIAQFPGVADNFGVVDFRLVFNDDAAHTGFQRSITDTETNDRVGITWGVEGTDMVARGWMDMSMPPGFRQVPYCEPYPTASCWLRRFRRWVPIAKDGDRYYMVETVAFDAENTGTLTVSDGAQRTNFWELQP